MKLLVQGDDYGFTKGVTYGILDAIENGVLRNTGLFANMPEAVEAVELIKKYPDVCLGIDFNIVSGKPVSDPKDIPHLVDENGEFIRSSVRTRDERWKSEEGRAEMFPYDEVYKEMRAQYDKFIQLVGKKPGYLHAHSLTPETYEKALRKIGEEEHLSYSHDLQEKYKMFNFRKLALKAPKVFDPVAQMNKTPLKDFLSHSEEALKSDYVLLTGHPGFVDAELLGLTTLSLERVRDHEMDTSDELKKWIKDNNVELITYNDLV